MNSVSFIPLGGIGDVTKNMYLYEYNNQILIVDCGLGFADETMLGVDLLLPDISYLLKTCLPAGKAPKKIIGMVLTHGHEDHIGALPFILPQLPEFPIYATPLTEAFATRKLKEYGVKNKINRVNFENPDINIGDFRISFVRVTHSVPDTSNVFIRTPVGNFYHGSDFKFEENPVDGKKTDFGKIEEFAKEGVLCLLSDCLGSERKGKTPSEINITGNFEREIEKCTGKFIVTTYSSNVARLNQIIQASERANRKVCFVGRSLVNAKDVAKDLGYLKINPGTEIEIDEIKNYANRQLTLIVAGSQGQENSAMTRMANNEHRDVKLVPNDVIVFSADPIPGNELSVYELVDTLLKKDIKVFYSGITSDFHVSGHASQDELSQLISLLKPKYLLPIGGKFRHMFYYRNLAKDLGYQKDKVFLIDDGQEIIFSQIDAKHGKIVSSKNVYVDEISGAELDSFVLRDRQKLSEGGIVIVLSEIDSENGQLIQNPDIIVRGFSGFDPKKLIARLSQDLRRALSVKKGRVTNWVYLRRLVGEISERRVFKEFHRRPLVLPVVIEV